MCIEFVMIF